MSDLPASIPAKLKWLHHLIAFVGDRTNPMVVRIVRQELRNRAFIGVYVILLIVAVITAVVTAGYSDIHREGGAAKILFGAMAWGWSFALVLVQPISILRTVTQERNDDTWDLIELTGLRPRNFLLGALIASLVQGMLYTSVLAPFMVMAYLLRGIEISTIVFALIVIPLMGVASSSLAIFIASLGGNKATRALLGAILGFGLITLWGMSAGMWFNSYVLSSLMRELLAWDKEAWLILGLWANMWIAFNISMIVLGCAMLTFKAANRSTSPRLLWYGLWLNGLLWFLGLPFFAPRAQLHEVLLVAGGCGVFWAAILGVFSLSEDYEITPRQARSLTEGSRWKRAAMLVLGPGAARGRFAYLVMAFASLATAVFGAWWSPPANDQELIFAWSSFCYFTIYAVIADWLARGWFKRLFSTPVLRRGFVFLVVTLASFVPLLVLTVIDVDLMQQSKFAALSPVMGIHHMTGKLSEWKGELIVLSVAGVLALIVLIRQGLRLTVTMRRVSDDQARARR